MNDAVTKSMKNALAMAYATEAYIAPAVFPGQDLVARPRPAPPPTVEFGPDVPPTGLGLPLTSIFEEGWKNEDPLDPSMHLAALSHNGPLFLKQGHPWLAVWQGLAQIECVRLRPGHLEGLVYAELTAHGRRVFEGLRARWNQRALGDVPPGWRERHAFWRGLQPGEHRVPSVQLVTDKGDRLELPPWVHLRIAHSAEDLQGKPGHLQVELRFLLRPTLDAMKRLATMALGLYLQGHLIFEPKRGNAHVVFGALHQDGSLDPTTIRLILPPKAAQRLAEVLLKLGPEVLDG